MPKWGYSIIPEMLNPEKTAKASGRELKISHKASREICKALKDMVLSDSKDYLRDVVVKKKPIPYTCFIKKLPHRHGINAFSAGSQLKLRKISST